MKFVLSLPYSNKHYKGEQLTSLHFSFIPEIIELTTKQPERNKNKMFKFKFTVIEISCVFYTSLKQPYTTDKYSQIVNLVKDIWLFNLRFQTR